MNNNMTIYEKSRKVPPEALKAIQGGRLKGMSDINPMWRLKMLTELFGMCGIGWKTEIVDRRLEKGHGDEVVCFVEINLYVKVDGEWSAAIPGMGGSSFIAMERNGAYTSDECYKMAYTDAISVACKSLGFAADVYFEKDRTKYTQGEEGQQQQVTRTSQTNQNPPRTTQSPTPDTSQRNNTTTPPEPISGAQKGLIRATMKERGIPEDVFKSWVHDLGLASSNDLSKKQASEIIKKAQAYVPEPSEDMADLPF